LKKTKETDFCSYTLYILPLCRQIFKRENGN
jgi:hypothetical protein